MYSDFIKQYKGKKDGGLIKVKRKAVAPKAKPKYAHGGVVNANDLILTERPL
jgi:hypothetical protein